jgi:hypothetical protein
VFPAFFVEQGIWESKEDNLNHPQRTGKASHYVILLHLHGTPGLLLRGLFVQGMANEINERLTSYVIHVHRVLISTSSGTLS